MRSCIMTGLPTNLVQELNVGTVLPKPSDLMHYYRPLAISCHDCSSMHMGRLNMTWDLEMVFPENPYSSNANNYRH